VSAATDTEHPVAGRSARKRQAILHAARDLFLRKGYAGTSMDGVALMAEASKVTIYKHFSDKQTLFIAVVTDAIDEAKAGSQSLVDQLGNSTDLELDLRDFARQHVALVTQLVGAQLPFLAHFLQRGQPGDIQHETAPRQVRRDCGRIGAQQLRVDHFFFLLSSASAIFISRPRGAGW